MGLFVALSGVIGADVNDVKNVLSKFTQSQNGGFELVEESPDAPNIGIITRNGPNTTVIYPDGFSEWDDVSRVLSEKLAKSVFSFHIHDGDFWMFILFSDGKEIGWFNPVPEYWEELPPNEKEKWKGDASLIAGLFPSVSVDAITKYFGEWDDDIEDEELKAYPDDEFTIEDCWQMCDFMKKIGFEYPIYDDGIHGDTFRFWTKGFRLHKTK